MTHPPSRRRRGVLVAVVAAAALLCTAVTPAHASERSPNPAETPLAGGFAVGDGVEALIDEHVGAARFGLTAGGVELGWNSAAAHSGDRFGFGPAWGPQLQFLQMDGGARMVTPAGETFDLAESWRSGLLGYPLGDLRIGVAGDDQPGARDGQTAGPAAFVLRELGGTTTYFNRDGDPITRLTAHGERTDLVWHPSSPHRLVGVIDEEGVATELEWKRDTVLVRPAANLPRPDGAEPAVWTIRLGEDGVEELEDPEGGRVELGYDSGLLDRIEGASGGHAQIEWHPSTDGVARVAAVRSFDAEDRELSERTWRLIGSETPTGWPIVGGTAGAGSYQTELSDGSTLLRSRYAHGMLESREVETATTGGTRIVQRQAFTYERHPDSEIPGAVPRHVWSHPTRVEVSHVAASGATRTDTSDLVYDDFGRVIRESRDDGTLVETTYDSTTNEPESGGPGAGEPGVDGAEPPPADPPVGLPVRVVTTAPDGLVRETRSTLNDVRTDVVVSETLVSGGALGAEPTPVERTEYTVEPDGFISETRAFPSGQASATPTVTRWAAETDLTAGEVTTVETRDVGTDAEASTSTTVSLVHGGTLRTSDVFGHLATAEYDLIGREIARTDTSGRTTSTAYETMQEHGRNATVTTGADGVVRTEIRDEVGRVRQLTDNIDRGVAVDGHVRIVETHDHDVPGTVTVTDAWGATASATQDAFGREVRTQGPTGLVQVTEYDDVGERVISGSTPSGRLADAAIVTTERWDAAARTSESTVERDDGVSVPAASSTLDGFGRTIASGDGFVSTTARYDAYGRQLTTTVAPAAGSGEPLVAERRFDDLGNPIEKRLTEGADTLSSGIRDLDAQGRLRAETDRADRQSGFEYSLDGLVTRAVDGAGHETTHTYDPLTRLLVRSVTTGPGTEPITKEYAYDPTTDALLAVFDPADRAGTEIRYEYDAFGNTLSVTYPDGGRIGHTYDLHGRRTSTTDPVGNVTSVEFDRAGAITRAVQVDPRGDEIARAEYVYDHYGRVATLRRGNDVVTETTYTSAGEIERETTRRGDRLVSRRAYVYDPRGLLAARTDTTVDEEGAEHSRYTEYRYDGRERLVGSSVHDGGTPDAEVIEARDYDVSLAGDVLAETVSTRGGEAPDTGTRRFEYSAQGELLAIDDDGAGSTQEYDAAGNLVRAADGTTYAYDSLQRQVRETTPGGATITTEYWADGTRRRVATTDADGVERATEFAWVDDTLVAETHEAGGEMTGTASYLIGAGRHARSTQLADGASTSYYVTDRHGSVTELTDAEGRVGDTYRYSDYGAEHARPGQVAGQCSAAGVGDVTRNPFRYSGEFTDPTCRQHLAVRMYDAGLMRFASLDPAAVMNPYGYADANPISLVDPTGNMPQEDATWNYVYMGMSIAGLIGTALSFLTPMGPLLTGIVLTAAAGDALGLASTTMRTLAHHGVELPGDPDDALLDELDAASWLSVVGIAAGGFAVFKRLRTWWRGGKGAQQAVAPGSKKLSLANGGGDNPPPGGHGAGGREHEPLLPGSKSGSSSRLPSKEHSTTRVESDYDEYRDLSLDSNGSPRWDPNSDALSAPGAPVATSTAPAPKPSASVASPSSRRRAAIANLPASEFGSTQSYAVVAMTKQGPKKTFWQGTGMAWSKKTTAAYDVKPRSRASVAPIGFSVGKPTSPHRPVEHGMLDAVRTTLLKWF